MLPAVAMFFCFVLFFYTGKLSDDSVRDYLPSVFSQRKGRQFAFKVAHSLFLGVVVLGVHSEAG